MMGLRHTDFDRLRSHRQLFGEDEDGGELDEAEKQGENGKTLQNNVDFLYLTGLSIANEIAALRKEAQAFKAVRAALRSAPEGDASSSGPSAAKLVFNKVRISGRLMSSCVSALSSLVNLLLP